MIRIAHFGSYNANVGDNIALLNIRKNINELCTKKIQWTNVCISKFHSSPKGRNNIKFSIDEFKKISEKNDLLIIGGGGLIEGSSSAKSKNQTGWKLPFTEEILSKIDIPIVCFSLGINYFRNYPALNSDATNNLWHLKNKSSLFSLRNDGSSDIYKSIFGEVCEEVADPGLIFSESIKFNKDDFNIKGQVKKGFFQPAWNNNIQQRAGRKYNSENLEKMSKLCQDFKLQIMPHTGKDYSFPHKSFLYQKSDFLKLVKFEKFEKIIEKYFQYDYSIAMRGHGQLISIGLGLPSVYFSTQDKVKHFSLKNGFRDYNVDIEQEFWNELLREKVNKLIKDENYIAKWYEIREKLMIECKQKFKNFCIKTIKLVE